MKTSVRLSVISLSLAFALVPATFGTSARAAFADDDNAAQSQQYGALERGYRTGYSDGYQAGWRDALDGNQRDFRNKEEYARADRAYLPAYGPREDYRDGYQQGFETGYESGYERSGFNSTVPEGLTRRGATTGSVAEQTDNGRSGAEVNRPEASGTEGVRPSVTIPADLVLRVELLNRLSTDVSQRGDSFEARVVEPSEYAGARVSGRLARVRRAGRVRGNSELQLDFEQISLTDGRWANFNAQLIEVRETDDREGVGEVDPEGGVRGENSTRDDVTKVGAGAGVGAIIGAIAGGGKGAAIGAIIGGSVGAGGALSSRGKDIRLEPGQQLVIRTSNATYIR